MVEFGKDANGNTVSAVRSYRRLFFYYLIMIGIQLHVLSEDLCLPTPLFHGTILCNALQGV